jgi:hypothetical protein
MDVLFYGDHDRGNGIRIQQVKDVRRRTGATHSGSITAEVQLR